MGMAAPVWLVATGAATTQTGSRRAWVEIPADLVLAAAGDHCPAAAYRGACPGVDPDDLARHRAATRAEFQGRPGTEVLADVERAMVALQAAPYAVLAPPTAGLLYGLCDGYCPGGAHTHDDAVRVRDLRSVGVVPELPEAAVRLGVAYLAAIPERDGRVKIVLGGAGEGTLAGRAPVEAFLGGWAAEQGLVGIYGDPARGYAGGYRAVGSRS